MNIPSLDQINLDWINLTFHENHIISPYDEVTDFSMTPLNSDKGFLSRLYLLHFKYLKDHSGDGDAPGEMVLKLSTSNKDLKDIIRMGRCYEKEIEFYRNINPHLRHRNMNCYYADLDRESYNQIILMDYCSCGENLSRKEGCSLEYAKAAIDAMAKLHAEYWNHTDAPELGNIPDYDELYHLKSMGQEALNAWFTDTWQKCLSHDGVDIPENLQKAYPLTFSHFAPLWHRLFDEEPRTMVHSDFQLDNLYFNRKGDDIDVSILDWQLIDKGRVSLDLAYFIVENLTVEDRRTHEAALIEYYHQRLRAQGIENYSLDDLKDDYELELTYRFARLVYDIANIPFDSGDMGIEINTLLPREIAALQDHKGFDMVLTL